MKVAVIPARRGSKGVPNKNVIDLAGRPCIEYTINAAVEARIFDDIVISTNDPKAIAIANNRGVTVLLRPEHLCRDESPAADVVKHVIATLDLKGDDVLCYLQPTSPLRTQDHIQEAMENLRLKQLPLVSVKESTELPYKMFTIENGLQPLFSDKHTNMRRQDLPKTYVANGAIYAFTVSQFNFAGGFPSTGGVPFVMDQISSMDLDTTEDLKKISEEIERRGKNGNQRN